MSIYKKLVSENYDIIEENYFKNVKDIYYNKDKFYDDEINLCFITGFSGSGKSTMGAAIQKKYDNVEWIDLDKDIIFKKDNFDEGKDICIAFYKGPGSKYKQMWESKWIERFDTFCSDICNDFVKFAKSYCSSHKNTKFIIEGVWLYRFVNPADLKDYAVFIKGTSAVTSSQRAAKRDYELRKETDIKKSKNISKYISKIRKDLLSMPDNESKINKYVNMFKDKK